VEGVPGRGRIVVSPDGWSIREFIFPDDYSACAQIWKTVGGGIKFSPSDSLEQIRMKLDYSPDLLLVATLGDQIVGTVIGGFDGRRGMIYHLAVDLAWQGKGIGKALMSEVERRIVAKGCHKMYLMMDHNHPELLDYYSRLGWQKMDVFIAAKEFNYK
jgi:predicted N-acetyltransferase YhbS